MLVTSIAEVTEVTTHVRVNDILIAVNGTCLAVMDKNQTMKDWKETFNSLKTPKLITFFRMFDAGPSSFDPVHVNCVDFSVTL